MRTGGTGTLGGVDALDVVPLDDGPLVTPEPLLGELVDALVGGRSAGLDHVEDPPLVRGQSSNFPSDAPAELRPLAEFLEIGRSKVTTKMSCQSTEDVER